MTVLTKTLIKESEELAVKNGTFSFRQLMFKAGEIAAELIMQKIELNCKKIAVVCGNGNNGGDGFVIANCFYEHGFDVTVITPLGKPLTEDALFYYSKLKSVRVVDEYEPCYDVIIDAVFGIGLNREPDGKLIKLFEKINSTDGIRIAIDIPSGVEADTGKIFNLAVKADFTVTFIAMKPCFLLPDGIDYCGDVLVADIGVVPVRQSYQIIEKPVFKKRRRNVNKSDFGTALMLCGSYGMAGAAILSTKAALRSGLGIAKCVICDSIYQAFTVSVPEAVCVPVLQSENGGFSSEGLDIKKLLTGCSAVLVGCGVGRSEDIEKIIVRIIEESTVPVVIDADGINCLANSIDILKKSKASIILTPHSGEMARLCKTKAEVIESDRIGYARKIACEYGCYVVLKGPATIVAEPTGEISFNTVGNSGMATGGSGDVLAGITVSLLAQGFDAVTAAKYAVYLHGEAGDRAALKRGERAMLPSDIIDLL